MVLPAAAAPGFYALKPLVRARVANEKQSAKQHPMKEDEPDARSFTIIALFERYEPATQLSDFFLHFKALQLSINTGKVHYSFEKIPLSPSKRATISASVIGILADNIGHTAVRRIGDVAGASVASR